MDLREALEWFDEDAGQVLPGSVPHDRIVAAARAVLDSEEAWWCETHWSGKATTVGELCDYARRFGHLVIEPKCRMVRVRLLAEEGT